MFYYIFRKIELQRREREVQIKVYLSNYTQNSKKNDN